MATTRRGLFGLLAGVAAFLAQKTLVAHGNKTGDDGLSAKSHEALEAMAEHAWYEDHWTFRHAVSFNRLYSPADERLAIELFLEWAAARGLYVVGKPRVYVERDDYAAWSGYAMEFLGDSWHEPKVPTRLNQRPSGPKEVLRGREEYYRA